MKIRIGENIQNLRKAKGLSLRKLSLEVRISHNNLASYERDAIVPSLENAVKISQYFDVPLEYLFMGEKAKFKYHDLELADLFGEVDRMEAKYRRMVKNFIRKIIKHKKEEERLLKESDSFELSQSESRKPAK
jgi:transcriptional regulator with XRE-family HTH domain